MAQIMQLAQSLSGGTGGNNAANAPPPPPVPAGRFFSRLGPAAADSAAIRRRSSLRPGRWAGSAAAPAVPAPDPGAGRSTGLQRPGSCCTHCGPISSRSGRRRWNGLSSWRACSTWAGNFWLDGRGETCITATSATTRAPTPVSRRRNPGIHRAAPPLPVSRNTRHPAAGSSLPIGTAPPAPA